MSIWTLTVFATACGGALLVWHAVSRTKDMSERMLQKYREMLDRAREEKAKKLAAEAASDPADTTAADSDQIIEV